MAQSNDDRLDRIERILETVVAAIVQQNQLVEVKSRETERRLEAIEREITELRTATTHLLEIAEVHQTNIEILFNEIKGLRTENLRIQQRLFREEGNKERS